MVDKLSSALQDRLDSIEDRRMLVRVVHYTEVVLRCSALIGSVVWVRQLPWTVVMEPYGAQMGCITDRPALAAFLVAAASMRILVTLCLASQ